MNMPASDASVPIVRFDDAHMPSQNHDSEVSDTDPSAPRRKSLRDRISALTDKAAIQDRLIEKLLAQVIPLDDGTDHSSTGEAPRPGHSKPGFSLPVMSNNFRRFNSRIGVVFVFQNRLAKLLTWRYPTHTLSFLAIFTFVCLDPYLLPLLPLAILLVGVMVPSFVTRHPAAPFSLSSEQAIGYAPYGPPLAPAATVRPAKELSKDFFRNMRDLQNSMGDFSDLHDAVTTHLLPRLNFSNEALSTTLFLFLFVACLLMSIAANLLPWRLVFLVAGWAVTVMGHPAVQRELAPAHERHLRPQEVKAMSWLERWIEGDVILDSAPETREVEIFELQRQTDSKAEWEPWLFCAWPYDPLSSARLAGDRPVGTRFFEDVLPPKGWEWSEKKWALDLWSREWVEERIITGVEVETEGERWVYDIYDENDMVDKIGVIEQERETGSPSTVQTVQTNGRRPTLKPSWEEGDEYESRRGQWRRRRWVRLVKRKTFSVE